MYKSMLVYFSAMLVSMVSADMIETSGCGRMEKLGVHNQWRWIVMAGEARFQFNGAVWNRLSAHLPEAESMNFGKVKGSDLAKEKLQEFISRVLGAFDSSLAMLDHEAELDKHLDYLHNRNEEMGLDSKVYKIVAEEIQNEAAARLGGYYAKTYWPACVNFIKSRVTPTHLPASPQQPETEEVESEGDKAGNAEEDNEIVLPGPEPEQLPEEEAEVVTGSSQEAENGMTTAMPGEVAMTEAPEVLAAEPAADAPVPENLPEITQPETLPEVAQPETLPEVAQPETLPEVAQLETLPEVAQPETLPEVAQPQTLPEVAEPENMPEVLADPATLPETANVAVNLPEPEPATLPELAGNEVVPETIPEEAGEEELQLAVGQSLYHRFFK